MFEGGVLPRVPVGGAAGTLSAPAGDVSAGAVGCVEDVVGLLGSLAAGGELAGVVEGLLARLLVTAQDHDDDSDGGGDGSGDGERCAADGDAAPALLTGESGADATLVAAAEGHRVVPLQEAGATGLLGLGARGLGELVAACHRLAAWAAWGESLAAACLTACGELSGHPGQWGPDGRVSSVVGFEERRFNTTCLLSARLGVSRSRAGQIVDHGSTLMDMGFTPTEVMERCGVLDSAKASLVTRRLGDVPAPVALAVQERVLPQAPRRSVSQVGRDIERALMETDPTGHAERVRANQERRCVSRPRPAGEGMSQVRLLLPTMDALLLDATLDAIAASARAAGEQRTPAQLRADAITAMTLSTLRTSQQSAYTQPCPRGAEHCGEDQAEVKSSGPAVPARLLPDGVPLEGLLGALSSLVGSASPWWTPSGTGHLPLPEGIHIDVQVTVPLTSLTDPGGLAQPEDATDHTPAAHDGPGGREPATSIGGNRLKDSDHGGYVPEGCAPKCGVPESAERPEGPCHPKSGRASPDKSPTIVTPDPLNDAASPHDRRGLPTTDGRSLPGSSGRSLPVPDPATPAFSCSAAHDSSPAASLSTALIAQPAASLAEVAEVRIGARSVAVPAMTAWALAAGGTWRRLVTDPASGVVIDVGRTRYRPPAGLADLVRARDRACVFPTCQTPAERCDIDHLTAWSQGGTTSLDNLVTLCEAHHRLKHTPGWALTKDNTSGVLSWYTPDKTVYQRHPNGTITRLPHKVGPRQCYIPGSVVPADLSQQIGPDILNRLNTALNNTSTGTGADPTGSARLVTRGPQPGQKPGAYEPTPYPKAAHTLQLAPLIDQAPPF
ncbi:HNH endonuclease signature motif containing protein [Actinomyces oris]|uniref:HNH endonuclease signature motif containing protein n=2 Tax=Actinomyces oris TaxID=544580 RepID=UPI0020BFB470|nr:HNH endonuclease signature motif containing protein [Actinomyces oris]